LCSGDVGENANLENQGHTKKSIVKQKKKKTSCPKQKRSKATKGGSGSRKKTKYQRLDGNRHRTAFKKTGSGQKTVVSLVKKGKTF